MFRTVGTEVLMRLYLVNIVTMSRGTPNSVVGDTRVYNFSGGVDYRVEDGNEVGS